MQIAYNIMCQLIAIKFVKLLNFSHIKNPSSLHNVNCKKLILIIICIHITYNDNQLKIQYSMPFKYNMYTVRYIRDNYQACIFINIKFIFIFYYYNPKE